MNFYNLKELLSITGLALFYFSFFVTIFNGVYFKFRPVKGWAQVIILDSLIILLASIPVVSGYIRFVPNS